MLQLYPYQLDGVRWLTEHRRGGLFDDQGLGKTVQALTALRQLSAARTLICAPAVALHNWKREVLLVDPTARVQVLRTGRDIVRGDATHVIVSHALFRMPKIDAQLHGFNALVIDEAQAFRNPYAKRSRRMFLGNDAMARRSPIVWALTGTPMPNDATNVWTMLAGIRPELVRDAETGKLLSYAQWRDRFCVTVPSGFSNQLKVVGIKRAPELRSRVMAFGLRRLKSDVLQDLPPIRYSDVLLDSSTRVRETFDPLKITDDTLDQLQADPSFAEWRHACGLAKVAPTIELLSDELREDPKRKVIVVAHHLDVIEQLVAGLGEFGCRSITGARSPQERYDAVNEFQTDPTTRVIVLQITAGGTAITLTAAQDVVFVEQSFVPGDNAQVADRAHRIGQRGSVHVRFLSLANSVDQIVGEILARKTAMIRQVLR